MVKLKTETLGNNYETNILKTLISFLQFCFHLYFKKTIVACVFWETSTASSRLEMLLSSLGCFSSGQRLFFSLYSTEWLIRSYLGGNSTYFTWEILRAVCQASSLHLELFWGMLLCNTPVIVKRSPRCISKLGALSDNVKWVISRLLIWGLFVPSCVCEFGAACFQWSWLVSELLVLI